MAIICSWMAAKPTSFGKVRLFPWVEASILLAFFTIMLLVHLINLLGFSTGGKNY